MIPSTAKLFVFQNSDIIILNTPLDLIKTKASYIKRKYITYIIYVYHVDTFRNNPDLRFD